ncbi:hypothetical protein [Nocardia cyriacigeorgica]|uniref:hypothetical protein n=1 Tax=Nocardia cyriacigeorgica TaxID=135487 RepID=UPI0024580DF8|nr:hypothetical protein [Nocardia cyriacigeorgica]
MSVLDTVGVTPQQLREMADAVAERFPSAVLVKNQVGNLAILDDGEYVGSLDLRFGGVNWLSDIEDAPEDTTETEKP